MCNLFFSLLLLLPLSLPLLLLLRLSRIRVHCARCVVMLVLLCYYDYYCYNFEIPVFWSYVLPIYLFLYIRMIVSGFLCSFLLFFFFGKQSTMTEPCDKYLSMYAPTNVFVSTHAYAHWLIRSIVLLFFVILVCSVFFFHFLWAFLIVTIIVAVDHLPFSFLFLCRLFYYAYTTLSQPIQIFTGSGQFALLSNHLIGFQYEN